MKVAFAVLVLVAASLFPITATAGTFKRITVDGGFEDWLGVPVTEIDEMDAMGDLDYRDVAIANDDDFLYVRVRLHAPASYANFHHQVLVDTDADGATGHPWGGLGSELFIENGASYQQKNGQFNEGAGSDLGWQVAPSGLSDQFEMRLSRSALDAEGLTFFQQDAIALTVLSQTLDWQLNDSVEALPYTLVTQPELFQGSKILTNFEDTFWFYQEIADPVAPDWLLPDYTGEVVQGLDETWQGGNGFFRLGGDAGAYPIASQVVLEGERTTIYFRTSFLWEHAAEGVALLAETYLSDGAVLYLNGEEVRRIRLPDGDITAETAAEGEASAPGELETFSLPAGALIVGENLLGVAVHQAVASPQTLAFGLRLSANDSVPPTFEDLDQPEDREIVEGQGTVLALGTIAGTEPFVFQWFKNGAPIPDVHGPRLEIPVVLQEDAGTYAVEVSNASGIVRSRDVSLTTIATEVQLASETLPADVTVAQGERLELSTEVIGSPPLAYQWFHNGAPIPEATGPTWMIEAVQLEDAGRYQLRASNRVNAVTTREAVITVETDARPPAVVSVSAGAGSVLIHFSEPLPEVAPSMFGIGGIDVLGAVLDESGRTVTLETAPLSFAETYSLAIDGVEDRFGNTLTSAHAFRASIRIDGDFSDWTGIDPVATEADGGGDLGFRQFWVANDADYLYLRFSVHGEITLPLDHFYQIFIDGDNDAATGLGVSTIGSSLMIENGSGWKQTDGGFNEGSVSDVDFLLAPTGSSTEFECRIALASSKDGVALVTGDAVGIAMNLVSPSWEVLATGPAEAIVHPLTEWELPGDPEPEPPVDAAAIAIRKVGAQVEIEWSSGTLEMSESLTQESWIPVPDAVSPWRTDPHQGVKFFRRTD